jgi:hypothetical protein
LLAMIISPVATILHFIQHEQPGTGISADREETLQDKDVNNKQMDPIKGLKLTLFLVPAFVNLVLLIGINGILMGTSFYRESNWIFYLFIATSANCILLALIMAGPSCFEMGFCTGSRPRSIAWTVAGVVQFLAWMVAISCEFMIPGFHGSMLAQINDGVAAGTIIVTTFQVVLMQLPPRHEGAFAMLMLFFFGLAMVFGQYLKIVPTKISEFTMYGKYLPFIIGVEGLLCISLAMLLIIPMIVKKKVAFTKTT